MPERKPDLIVRMRAPPAGTLGGMYATGAGVDDIVRIAAMHPSFARQQTWQLKPIEGKADMYHIILMDGANHEPWVWSSIGSEPQPDCPIILSTDKGKMVAFKMQPLDIGAMDAFTLIADVGLIGATWYAGTIGNSVAFKVLPIDAPLDEKPFWVITETSPPE